MGILQSCEGQDPSLRLSVDQQLFRNTTSSKFSPDDYTFKSSKLKLFGELLNRKSQSKTQFVLQTHITNRGSRVINQSLKIYQDASTFINERGSKIKLDTPINDPNHLGQQQIYIGKIQDKPGQIIIKAIPFDRYEQQSFKQGLYEIAMLQKTIREQNNRYGYVFQQAFIVESGLDKDKYDKALIIIGENASATLYEVLNFRKIMKLNWTESQFEILCYQLIKNLYDMHCLKIAHRDIRPSNIFYCPYKHSYVIGEMNNAVTLLDKDERTTGYNLCGVPYYLPQYLIQIGKRQDFSEYYNYDPLQNDIYALGVTLLNCLFLDQFSPPKYLAGSLQKYISKFSFLKLVKDMISDHPPKLSQILTTLTKGQSWLQQKSNIQSLRFKMKPQDDQFVTRKKTIAQGYYSMFLYDQWVEQINQVVNYYQMNNNHMQLGDIYKKIGDIYMSHDQTEMMQEYFHKASSTYLHISSECLNEGKVDEGIKYLEKGIESNRKGYQGQPNHDLAHLLNRLALTYHKKGDYQVARAFQEESVDIIGKVYGTASIQFAEMLIDSAKIQSQFQQFKQAENMLKAGVKIMDKKDDAPVNVKIKGRLLEALGSNYRMKALERKQKCDVYRRKGEECLLDALEMTERVQGNISPQVGSIMMSLGNIYFDKREFEKARRSYQKALIVKQHNQGRRQSIQVGECLTYLANSQKCLRQVQKSIKHNDQAIQVFRKSYGNDHNENTAVAIGNLGLVYKQLGKRQQQREYLSLAKTILKDLFGEQCPDYQYFDRQSR